MKQLFFIFSMLLLTIDVSAGDVSREQAREIASQFLKKKSIERMLSPVDAQKPLRRSSSEADCFHVFNVGQNEGFVIVSGDDRTPEILGYTDHGTYDVDNLPPNFVNWLKCRTEEISYMREHNIESSPATHSMRSARAAVAPMLKTKWGQSYPFNMGYPEVNGQACITGCVATALAQVLYYHKYPIGNTTEIPGYTTSTHHIQMSTLQPTTFDWGNMALTYNSNSTQAQKVAVSHLMFYCSTAVKANLDPGGTGAYSYQQLVSLRNYFGYSKNAKQVSRSKYSLSKWEDMMYEEVAAGRPVLYSGNAGDGQAGHAFVLDGYDGENFHFNWGWNGTCDGNFALTALNPSGYNFSSNQDAIIGISPTEIAPPVYNEEVRLTTDTFYPYNWNDNDKFTRYPPSSDGVGHYTVRFGAKISSHLKGTYDIDDNYAIYKDGEFIEYLYPFDIENPKFGINFNMAEEDFFPYGYEALMTLPHSDTDGAGNVTHSLSFREPGTYYIVPVSRQHGDLEWKANYDSDKKFLKAVIDENDVLTLYKGDPSEYPGSGTIAKVTLSKKEVVVKKNKTVTLKATVSPETLPDKSVTWKSSDTKIATVTSDGTVKGVKTGTVTITCTSVATGAKATCKVTVATITLDQTNVVVRKNKTVTLTPTVYPTTLEDKSVKWKSSDKTIATVSSSGVVKGVKTGTVTITCTSVATGLSATCKVTVGTITLDQTKVVVRKNKTVTLTPTVYPTTLTDKSVKWESSDKTIATVSSNGVVKGVKTGTVTITCTSVATGLSTTCEVIVGTITLDKTKVVVRKNKTVKLTPTVYPTTLADKSVKWQSSDKKIATVASDGTVTGVKTGIVTITCTSVATGLSTTCEVTVGTITLDQTSVTVIKGNNVKLTPTVYPTTLTDKSVTWKSSKTTVATVSEDGTVKGVKAGTATITCTSVATGLSTTCKVTVTASSGVRTLDGDDADVTGIENLDETPVVEEPFDVYNLGGRQVLKRVTSLDGLPAGVYVVNGKKVMKK